MSQALVKVWPGRPPWVKHDGAWICLSLMDSTYFAERTTWKARLLEVGEDRKAYTGFKRWRGQWDTRYAAVGQVRPKLRIGPAAAQWCGRVGGRRRREVCDFGHRIEVRGARQQRVCYTCKRQYQNARAARLKVERAFAKYQRVTAAIAEERTSSSRAQRTAA